MQNSSRESGRGNREKRRFADISRSGGRAIEKPLDSLYPPPARPLARMISPRVHKMSLEQIHQAIPHRPPFLLVDEIVEWDENRIVCEKTLTGDEFWFAGHYPGHPIMPGVLQCEAAMQAGAILLSKHISAGDGEKVPVATRLGDVRFKQIVQPGDTMTLEAELTERLADAFFLKGKVTVGGKVTTRFEFACTLAPAP